MRSFSSGTISFGFSRIPVKISTATESKELEVHFLHKEDVTPTGFDTAAKAA